MGVKRGVPGAALPALRQRRVKPRDRGAGARQPGAGRHHHVTRLSRDQPDARPRGGR